MSGGEVAFRASNTISLKLECIKRFYLDPLLNLALHHIVPVLRRPGKVVESIVNGMGGVSEDHVAVVHPSICVWQGTLSPLPKRPQAAPLLAAGQPERFSHSVVWSLNAPAAQASRSWKRRYSIR